MSCILSRTVSIEYTVTVQQAVIEWSGRTLLAETLSKLSQCVAMLKCQGTALHTNHSTDLHYHVPLWLCHGKKMTFCFALLFICLNVPTNSAISGNYRRITLSSVFGRLIDLLILHR